MRTLKLASFYFLILFFVFYDQEIKRVNEYSVNLSILYFAGVYIFILFWMYVGFTELGKGRWLVLALAIPIFIRLGLNLMGINKTYSEYVKLVNNEIIDYATWVGLIIGTILIIWRRYIT